MLNKNDKLNHINNIKDIIAFNACAKKDTHYFTYSTWLICNRGNLSQFWGQIVILSPSQGPDQII